MLRFGIITASDRSSRGERSDASGPALAETIRAHGWIAAEAVILPDDFAQLRARMIAWADNESADVILITGGTGFAPRDITPEATRSVVEKLTPGIDEAMRSASLRITPHAMLSRGVSGIRKRTLIVNLPGSPKGAVENFETIASVLAHAIDLIRADPGAEAGHQSRG
jgi:molybdenum cofactor synthesis domain-containing protein